MSFPPELSGDVCFEFGAGVDVSPDCIQDGVFESLRAASPSRSETAQEFAAFDWGLDSSSPQQENSLPILEPDLVSTLDWATADDTPAPTDVATSDGVAGISAHTTPTKISVPTVPSEASEDDFLARVRSTALAAAGPSTPLEHVMASHLHATPSLTDEDARACGATVGPAPSSIPADATAATAIPVFARWPVPQRPRIVFLARYCTAYLYLPELALSSIGVRVGSHGAQPRRLCRVTPSLEYLSRPGAKPVPLAALLDARISRHDCGGVSSSAPLEVYIDNPGRLRVDSHGLLRVGFKIGQKGDAVCCSNASRAPFSVSFCIHRVLRGEAAEAYVEESVPATVSAGTASADVSVAGGAATSVRIATTPTAVGSLVVDRVNHQPSRTKLSRVLAAQQAAALSKGDQEGAPRDDATLMLQWLARVSRRVHELPSVSHAAAVQAWQNDVQNPPRGLLAGPSAKRLSAAPALGSFRAPTSGPMSSRSSMLSMCSDSPFGSSSACSGKPSASVRLLSSSRWGSLSGTSLGSSAFTNTSYSSTSSNGGSRGAAAFGSIPSSVLNMTSVASAAAASDLVRRWIPTKPAATASGAGAAAPRSGGDIFERMNVSAATSAVASSSGIAVVSPGVGGGTFGGVTHALSQSIPRALASGNMLMNTMTSTFLKTAPRTLMLGCAVPFSLSVDPSKRPE